MFMYPSPKVQPTTCSFFKVTKGLNPANGISLNSQRNSTLLFIINKKRIQKLIALLTQNDNSLPY